MLLKREICGIYSYKTWRELSLCRNCQQNVRKIRCWSKQTVNKMKDKSSAAEGRLQVPAGKGRMGYYPPSCIFCWVAARGKNSLRQKCNFNYSAVLLTIHEDHYWHIPYGCRSGSVNAERAWTAVLHRLHLLTYFPLVSVAACWNTGCILLQTPHPRTEYNTVYCAGKGQDRTETRIMKDKNTAANEGTYTLLFS